MVPTLPNFDNGPVLSKSFEGIECSNGVDITFSWNAINNMTGYNLYVAKHIPNTSNYDWNNARIYLPGTNSTQHTIGKGSLSVSSYAAYVQSINISTGYTSKQSNFIYFNIIDDILFDIYITKDATYDLNEVNSFKVRGWAVNTSRKDVDCYLSIDNKEEILLNKQQRTDVCNSPLYYDFLHN